MRKTYLIIDINGIEKGPIYLSMIKKNGINKDTLTWFVGLPFWVKADTVPEFKNHIRSVGVESLEGLPPVKTIDEKHKKFLMNSIYANETEKMNIASQFHPKTAMTKSILVTLLCFFPFGLVALVNSARVAPLWKTGRYAESLEASENAIWWVKWSLLIAVVFWAAWGLYLVFFPSALRTINYLIENLSNSPFTD